MALLVKVAWPEHLEAQENKGENIGGVGQSASAPTETPLPGSVPASRVEEKPELAGS
jgi:hypothetical protein